LPGTHGIRLSSTTWRLYVRKINLIVFIMFAVAGCATSYEKIKEQCREQTKTEYEMNVCISERNVNASPSQESESTGPTFGQRLGAFFKALGNGMAHKQTTTCTSRQVGDHVETTCEQ